jgi:hypothetical protein
MELGCRATCIRTVTGPVCKARGRRDDTQADTKTAEWGWRTRTDSDVVESRDGR